MPDNEQALITIDPYPLDLTDELGQIGAGVAMIEEAAKITITDFDAEAQALTVAKNAQQAAKKLDAKRLEFTLPFRTAADRVNNMVAPFVSRLTAVQKDILKRQQEFRAQMAAEQRRIDEEKRRQEEEQRKQRMLEDMETESPAPPTPPPAREAAPVAAPPPVSTGGAKVSTRRQWKYRIVDEKKVPKQYWQINETLIAANVKAGVREIPGVEIYSEDAPVLR